jgi:HSP20 family protein
MRIIRYTYPNRVSPVLDRSPWAGLETEIERLFNSALNDFVSGPVLGNSRFPVDMFEDKENAYVRADLPGVSRDDINVEVVDGFLNIGASRKTKEGEQEQAFNLSRSISLPDTVNADGVSASYEHGVLTVTLPKREEAKPRKISVAVK